MKEPKPKLSNKLVEKLAKEIGFDLVGFAKFEMLDKEIEHLENWLANNYHGGMEYMSRNLSKRRDVREILSDAKSVISLGVNYFYPEKHEAKECYGKVSRYAWGKDYHYLIWEMLEKLEQKLSEIEPEFKSKSYVDTGPVMDSIWAQKAGLGWIGKNSMVINPKLGSWFFVANIICNYEFTPSVPLTEKCGTCTACIDACPTDAIVELTVIDANRCISYLTIENKGEIPLEFKGKFNNWIFGCDDCQDVCPWNKKFATPTNKDEFKPQFKVLPLDLFDNLTNRKFNNLFKESPIKRARLKGMKRNAHFLIDEEICN